jgi:hypothetical protein
MKLLPGQVTCHVCECPGTINLLDKKPGLQIWHPGRTFPCRDLTQKAKSNS